MAFTREQIEKQITEKRKKGKSRKQAIAELMKGAEKGLFAAQQSITEAQTDLIAAQTEVGRLNSKIAVEGRNVSNEQQTINILKKIIEDDKKAER